MLHDFSYHRPGTLPEALDFLAHHGSESAVLSGGTDLFVVIRAGIVTPAHVIDLKGIEELSRLTWDEKEGLSVGACVTVNDLIESPVVMKHFPVLPVAGHELATFQLRNRATMVGNLVTASPCGDMGSPLLTLGGEVVLVSARGERRMPVAQFITGVKRTLIEPDEIVQRVVIPPVWADAAGGYHKLKRIKGHDLGVVSVAMIRKAETLRCAISSAAPTPILLPDISLPTSLEAVQQKAQEMISPIDDVRCTKEYRAFMVGIFIKRLMQELGAVV